MEDRNSFYYQKLQLEQRLTMKENEINAEIRELFHAETWLPGAFYRKLSWWRSILTESADLIKNVVRPNGNGKPKEGFLTSAAITTMATLKNFRHIIDAVRDIYDVFQHKKQ